MSGSEAGLPGLMEVLQGFELFHGLDDGALRSLVERLELVSVAGGDVVLREGDPADALYIVRRGRLRASALDVNGTERSLSESGPGAVVGELALLSDRARTATVSAVRDSELLRLRADDFHEIVAAYPATIRRLAANLANRLVLRDMAPLIGPTSPVRNIAIVPGGRRPDRARVDELVRRLAISLAHHGTTDVVDRDVCDRVVGAGTADAGVGDAHGVEVGAWLDGVEVEHRFVLQVTDATATGWTHRCLRQADRVLLVGVAGTAPALSDLERVALGFPGGARRDLVLVHPTAASPSGTAAWLGPRPVTAHHHVRADRGDDHERLARVIAGRDVGVVLAGGGPRGFAHLGVLRAIEEANVPIDSVAGTSIGAIMGGVVAMGWDDDTRCQRAIEAFVATKRLLGFTLPTVAMSSGRTLTRLLRHERFFAETAIEDLWLPFACVSANLTRAEVVVHDSGPLWWALRASISLPGVLPPVWREGDLLVDGGVLNNLPVDVMRARVAGPIIAIDLATPGEHGSFARFSPSLSGWGVLASRILRLGTRLALPNPIELMMRAKDISARHLERSTLLGTPVDLYFNPPTTGYPILDFARGPELIEVGYRYAKEHLEAHPPTFAT